MNSKENIKKNKIKIELEEIKCDFCKSKSYNVIYQSKDYYFKKIEGSFKIVRCKRCGLNYTNPKITNKSSKEMYSHFLNYDNRPIRLLRENRLSLPFRKELLTDFFGYPFGKPNKIRKILFYPNFLLIRRKWKKTLYIPEYIRDGKILEIGSSYGTYLYLLQKLGWNTLGLELNNNAVAYAKKKLNLEVHQTSIENFQIKDYFDIIYMQMVFEHLESPLKVLTKCYNLLKNGGKIIIRIPDINGFEVFLYKEYAYTLQLPFHLFHFSPNTIRNYLKRLNFKKIRIIHDRTDRDLIAPLKYMINENSNKIGIKLLFEFLYFSLIRKTLLKIFVFFLSLLHKTSRMTVIAEK